MKRKADIPRSLLVISLAFGVLIFGSQSCSTHQTSSFQTPSNDADPSWSPDGSRIAFRSNRDGNFDIYFMSADGSDQTRLTSNPARDDKPSWSPDGTRIAFQSNRDGNQEIYIMNADGSNPIRLTDNPAYDREPSWSPDGQKIAFESERDGNGEIYTMDADGSNPTRLTDNPANEWDPSWSPDGQKIAFSSERDGNLEIYMMNTDGSNPTRLTDNPAYDEMPSWSPDGTRIIFDSDRDGNFKIYTMNTDGSNQARLTDSPADDWRPSWSPDGRKIAFASGRDFVREVYVMDADGSNPVNLTNNAPIDDTFGSAPLPQSELDLDKIPYRIVFESYRETDGKENWEICLINADGSNLINLTNTPEIDERYPQASPDGSMICFEAHEGEDQESRSRNVYYMNIDGTGRTKVAENAYQPCWSPGGKRIAYLPGEFSRYDPKKYANKGLEIYHLETKQVERHPNEDLRNMSNLCWSPDGDWFVSKFTFRGNHAFKVDGSTVMGLSTMGCTPDISPDGEQLAWNGTDRSLLIGTFDFDSPQSNVTDHRVVVACEREYWVYDADWSPDGNYLAFSYGPVSGSEGVSQPAPGWNICVCDLRTGKWTQITTDGNDNNQPDWVPVRSPRP